MSELFANNNGVKLGDEEMCFSASKEPLRRTVYEQCLDESEKLDREIIRQYVEKTERTYGKTSSAEDYKLYLYRLLEEYFKNSLPDLDRGNGMMGSGLWGMIVTSHSEEVDEQVDRYNGYLQTVREIGQDNANKLFEELGIVHFADWSPEVLQGTLHILETGRTESGNPATIIVRGSSGDRNGAARYFREITSPDTLAVEIECTDALSGIVERLERVGISASTFNTVVLFGHGSEKNSFTMSSTEDIPADPGEWYGKKGMRDLIRRFKLSRLVLVSCYPLMREDKFMPLTIGEGELQRRKGMASAISIAFSVTVESGLDGKTCIYVNKEGGIDLVTVYDTGNEVVETSKMASTRYGLTCIKKKADKPAPIK